MIGFIILILLIHELVMPSHFLMSFLIFFLRKFHYRGLPLFELGLFQSILLSFVLLCMRICPCSLSQCVCCWCVERQLIFVLYHFNEVVCRTLLVKNFGSLTYICSLCFLMSLYGFVVRVILDP